MASSVPLQVAETVQTAHIRQDPSLDDVAPSTSVDEKVVIDPAVVDEEEDDDDDDDEDDDEEEIPYSVVRPWDDASSHHHRGILEAAAAASRKHHLPPMPDLRFEQSYLRSLSAADTWWKVALVTIRDQVVMPMVQGVLYNLAVCGWQYWNKSAQLSGQSVGARVRRWWYGVNNWPIPKEKRF